MYVGRQADPYFYQQIFGVNAYTQIDRNVSEDEIFGRAAESQYLTALNGII